MPKSSTGGENPADYAKTLKTETFVDCRRRWKYTEGGKKAEEKASLRSTVLAGAPWEAGGKDLH